MNKKRWIIGIAAVVLTVFAVKGVLHYRWSQLSAGEKAGTITEKMARHLDLSAEQKENLYALNLQQMQAFEAARQTDGCDRAHWKQLRETWRTGVQEILTPEQRARFRPFRHS